MRLVFIVPWSNHPVASLLTYMLLMIKCSHILLWKVWGVFSYFVFSCPLERDLENLCSQPIPFLEPITWFMFYLRSTWFLSSAKHLFLHGFVLYHWIWMQIPEIQQIRIHSCIASCLWPLATRILSKFVLYFECCILSVAWVRHSKNFYFLIKNFLGTLLNNFLIAH